MEWQKDCDLQKVQWCLCWYTSRSHTNWHSWLTLVVCGRWSRKWICIYMNNCTCICMHVHINAEIQWNWVFTCCLYLLVSFQNPFIIFFLCISCNHYIWWNDISSSGSCVLYKSYIYSWWHFVKQFSCHVHVASLLKHFVKIALMVICIHWYFWEYWNTLSQLGVYCNIHVIPGLIL